MPKVTVSHQKVLMRVTSRMNVDTAPPMSAKYRGLFASMWTRMLLWALHEASRPHQLTLRPHRERFRKRDGLPSKVAAYCIRCDAEEWVNGADLGGVLFTDVCEEFGLDPHAVQRAMREMNSPCSTRHTNASIIKDALATG